MDNRLRVCGHWIQPMLVPLPVGLFACATVFDLADLWGAPALIGTLGYWTAVAGLTAAAAVTAVGMVDVWDVPRCPTRRTVLTVHGSTVVSALLVVMGCLIRAQVADRGATAGVVVVQLFAVAIGTVAVLLGMRLARQVEPAPTEATTFDVSGGPFVAAPAGTRLRDGAAPVP
jgi:uncharacterized membrane protein